MKRSTLLILVSCAPGLVYAADDTADWNDMVRGKTYFQYEHNFKTRDRRHGDSFKLVQKTEDDWSWELKFSTTGGSGKKFDSAFEDSVSGSAGLVIQKGLSLPKGFSLTPSFETNMGSNFLQYLAGGSLSLPRFSKDWSSYVRYRYQYRKYNRTDRWATASLYTNGVNSSGGYTSVTYRKQADLGTHRLEAGLSYSGIKNWGITLMTLYDRADYVNNVMSCTKYGCTASEYTMFNNKKGYWYNEIKVQYRGWGDFIPYVEVDQQNYSGSSVKEQAAVKTGFNYYF